MQVSSEPGFKVDSVVLAGQANQGPFKDEYQVPNEALIPAGGYPLLRWVLGALAESEVVGRVVVVGPPDDLAPALPPPGIRSEIEAVPPGETITDNIRRGARALQTERWILLVTADLPLITGDMVSEFAQTALDGEADFYYPVVPSERVEEVYPGVERTYVKVAGQQFTGGNLFLVRPGVVEPALHLVDRFFRHRKNPVKLASILGPGFILRLLTGRLTLPDLEAKVSDMVGARGQVVISDHPEIGFDVDKPSHVEPIERALLGRVPGPW